MLIGVIADDFTGASDIANVLARGRIASGGLRTTQFMGIPDQAAASDCEAGVISLKSRSIPAEEACRQSLLALDWLLSQGCRQIVFKYCSTFNSTPDGNIGPVAEALAEALGVYGVAVCPAFPAAGRTVYQGHLFVGDKLLNKSGLQNHPLTPMTDPDIRRWLQRQCREAVGHAPLETVRSGADTLSASLGNAARSGQRLVVIDAIDDADLVTIGTAVGSERLITGGSGIALALPELVAAEERTAGGTKAFEGVRGPEVILAGSCSKATLAQIDHHLSGGHPSMAVDVTELLSGRIRVEDAVEFVRRNPGQAPLVYSSAPAERVGEAQAKFGREEVAGRLDAFFGEVAQRLVAGGLRRLVVAGGETSGAVVKALDLKSVEIGPEIDVGVPVLQACGDQPLVLALKSGNFGSTDFFTKALNILCGDDA